MEPVTPKADPGETPDADAIRGQWAAGGIGFAADGPLHDAWHAAARGLAGCVVRHADGRAVLHEGGGYGGAWVESTASISAETLARFLPRTAVDTVRAVLSAPREDGLLPYKVTPEGPAYRQIQMVTPFARSVRTVARLADAGLLADAYPVLAAHDAWLADHRDTRETGGVEAFCTYDTGHDRSPRFWHVPDGCPGGDPASYDRDNPRLPFVAPDLTANVACQRDQLAVMASARGEDPAAWRVRAEQSRAALWQSCWHPGDGTFYDLDAAGRHVRVSTDVLLRVLACDVGDDRFFDAALERHLLDTRRFFAAYPFTSVSMDDPRFDAHVGHNTWAGATNLLSLLRAPHAFERHGRFTELTWALWPTVAALTRAGRFPQTLSPWVGEAGFAADYSPAMLALLDFVERCCGVLPRPDGETWCTALTPPQVQHDVAAVRTVYSRTVGGRRLVLHVSAAGATLTMEGEEVATWPAGLRLVLGTDGLPTRLVGMVAREVRGTLRWRGRRTDVSIRGNEQWTWREGALTRSRAPGVLLPR